MSQVRSVTDGRDVPLHRRRCRQEKRDDPRKGQIVNLRYFAGLTAQDTAAALGVSVGTVEREWRYIRTWLFAQLSEGEGVSTADEPPSQSSGGDALSERSEPGS